MLSVGVVIVAAGRGRRLGGEIPKQYIPLKERCSLRRVIETFLSVDAVKWIVTVMHGDDADLYRDAVDGLHDTRILPAVQGGETRATSVRCGLEGLEPLRPDLVLIHDSARPFLPLDVVHDVIAALGSSEGACAALPVVDALWRSQDGTAQTSVPRDGLWRAQTPQGFWFDKLLSAHRTHDGSGADDVAVAREAGMQVALVQGSERNYKITTASDLARALADAQFLDAQFLDAQSLDAQIDGTRDGRAQMSGE